MQEHRAFDALYDKTVYTVSGPRDHYREQSRAAGFLLERCPEYTNMFSELPAYPSQTYRFKSNDKVPDFVGREFDFNTIYSSRQTQQEQSQPHQVSGVHRHKFFRRPLLPPGPPLANLAPPPPLTMEQEPEELPAGTKVTMGTQSDYRESEAQTIPYAPDYVIPESTTDKQAHLTVKHNMPEGVPEVLTLQHLKYGHGLPPGLAEVEMVEKQRLKRAFEASLPPLQDLARLPLRQKLMEMWETREWNEREEEIKGLQDERLEVIQRAIAVREEQLEDKAQRRVDNLKAGRLAEKQKVFAQIQQRRVNALRKLTRARRNVEAPKPDLVDEYSQFSSQVYAPSTRLGQFPDSKPRGLTIDPKPFEPVNYREVVELEATMPPRMKIAQTARPEKQRPKNAEEREEAAIARQLGHIESLLAASKAEFGEKGHGACWPAPLEEKEAARRRRMHGPERPETPFLEDDSAAVQRRAAIVLVQRVLRGRAVQNNMYEGKRMRLELIKELQLEELLEPPEPHPLPNQQMQDINRYVAHAMVEILKILTLTSANEQSQALAVVEARRAEHLEQEQAEAAVKIQAAVRGRQARKQLKSGEAGHQDTDIRPPSQGLLQNDFMEQKLLDAGGTFESAEQEQAALKIQAIQRGRVARRQVEDMRKDGAAIRERMKNQTGGKSRQQSQKMGILEEAEFTEEQKAAMITMQAGARGYKDRKRVKELRKEKKKAAEKAELEATVYDEEQQKAIVKIQAASRGRQARKQVQAARGPPPALVQQDYTPEEELAIVKIQAGARGRMARKQTDQKKAAKKKEKAKMETLATEEVYDEEQQKAVVQIQARARGHLARKRVVEKKTKINRYTGEEIEDESVDPNKVQVGLRKTDEDEAKREAALKLKEAQAVAEEQAEKAKTEGQF